MFEWQSKTKLKHYKSYDNLFTEYRNHKVAKNSIKKHESQAKILPQHDHQKLKNRFVTQTNDRTFETKEELKKISHLFKNKMEGKGSGNISKKGYQNHKSNQVSGLNHQGSRHKISIDLLTKFTTQKTQTGALIKRKINHDQKQARKCKKTKVLNSNQLFVKDAMLSPFKLGNRKRMEKGKEKCSKPSSLPKKYKSQSPFKKMYVNMSLQSTPSCLHNDQIELIDMVGQGTFGKVFKAVLKKTGEIIAVKKVVQDSRYKNRQVEIIRLLHNDFVMDVIGSFITYEAGYEYLNIMMKYYDESLYSRIKAVGKGKMNSFETKIIIYQIFKGLSYIHSLNICHRDIKPQNILLKGNSVVLCDFGSAKVITPKEKNISYICARCYRAPELIFGATQYCSVVDIWSAGCVILEMLNGDPLFVGDTSVNHLIQIIKVLGTPTQSEVIAMNPEYDIRDYNFPRIKKKEWNEIFPNLDPLLIEILNKTMVYSPKERLSALQILSMEYFDEIRVESVYSHIEKQFRLKDLFNFSDAELSSYKYLKTKVVPAWRK